jgi:hypothetical protein
VAECRRVRAEAEAGGDGRGRIVCGCGAGVRARMCVSRPKISEVCTEANATKKCISNYHKGA